MAVGAIPYGRRRNSSSPKMLRSRFNDGLMPEWVKAQLRSNVQCLSHRVRIDRHGLAMNRE
jgi:hypothetical protein